MLQLPRFLQPRQEAPKRRQQEDDGEDTNSLLDEAESTKGVERRPSPPKQPRRGERGAASALQNHHFSSRAPGQNKLQDGVVGLDDFLATAAQRRIRREDDQGGDAATNIAPPAVPVLPTSYMLTCPTLLRLSGDAPHVAYSARQALHCEVQVLPLHFVSATLVVLLS